MRQRGLVTRRRVKRRWEWRGVDEKERRVTKGVCGNEMSLMRPVECMYVSRYISTDVCIWKG